MGGLQNLDPLAGHGIAVSDDDRSLLERGPSTAVPRTDHLSSALTGADDNGAALWDGRKVIGNGSFGLRGHHRGRKQMLKETPRFCRRLHLQTPFHRFLKGSIVEFVCDAKGSKGEENERQIQTTRIALRTRCASGCAVQSPNRGDSSVFSRSDAGDGPSERFA